MNILAINPWFLEPGNFQYAIQFAIWPLAAILYFWLIARIVRRKDFMDYAKIKLTDIKVMSDIEWHVDNLRHFWEDDLPELYERAILSKSLTKKFKKLYWDTYHYVKKNWEEVAQWTREHGCILDKATFQKYCQSHRLQYNG